MDELSQEAQTALKSATKALSDLKTLTDYEREVIESYLGDWYTLEQSIDLIKNNGE